MSSSSVGMTKSRTREPLAPTSPSSPAGRASFFVASSSIPSQSSPWHTRRRTCGEFSPIPALNTIASALDPADDAGVDSGVGAEALAAVHDAVTDRVHLAGGIDHPAVVARIVVGPDEPSHHPLDGGAVVADRLGELPGFSVVRSIRAQGLPADAFDDTAREPGLGRGIHELELERRGAAVEDEHVHFEHSRTGRRA